MLQPKVYFQSPDNVFKLKIPHKLSLTFIFEVPQRCFFEAIIPESVGA